MLRQQGCLVVHVTSSFLVLGLKGGFTERPCRIRTLDLHRIYRRLIPEAPAIGGELDQASSNFVLPWPVHSRSGTHPIPATRRRQVAGLKRRNDHCPSAAFSRI